jgi:hypothetical protein
MHKSEWDSLVCGILWDVIDYFSTDRKNPNRRGMNKFCAAVIDGLETERREQVAERFYQITTKWKSQLQPFRQYREAEGDSA